MYNVDSTSLTVFNAVLGIRFYMYLKMLDIFTVPVCSFFHVFLDCGFGEDTWMILVGKIAVSSITYDCALMIGLGNMIRVFRNTMTSLSQTRDSVRGFASYNSDLLCK